MPGLAYLLSLNTLFPAWNAGGSVLKLSCPNPTRKPPAKKAEPHSRCWCKELGILSDTSVSLFKIISSSKFCQEFSFGLFISKVEQVMLMRALLIHFRA